MRGWIGLQRKMPIIVLSPFLDQDVVCDGVPGVVNADEEQQQRRRPNAKNSAAPAWERAAYADTASVAYAAKGSRK